MATGNEQQYFRDLSRDQQLAAVQLYLGPYARGDAIRRTLGEAAVNPTVAASVMRHAPVGNADAGGMAGQVSNVVDQGDSGTTFADPGVVASAPDVAVDSGSDRSNIPGTAAALIGGGAAALAAAEMLRRRGGGTNAPESPGSAHTGPSARPTTDPAGGGTANAPSGDGPRALPPPAPGGSAQPFVHEGDFIPGDPDRPVATTPGHVGNVYEGEVIRDPVDGSYYILDNEGNRLPYDPDSPMRPMIPGPAPAPTSGGSTFALPRTGNVIKRALR